MRRNAMSRQAIDQGVHEGTKARNLILFRVFVLSCTTICIKRASRTIVSSRLRELFTIRVKDDSRVSMTVWGAHGSILIRISPNHQVMRRVVRQSLNLPLTQSLNALPKNALVYRIYT